jgi:hypothetical protein
MNPTNFTNNFELIMLNNSIANLTNYIRTVNSSIEYLNNASANIRYMQEHINYYYHASNFQLLVNNNALFQASSVNNVNNENSVNNVNNENTENNENSVNNVNNENSELTYEYFQEVSLTNLKTIIKNNISECDFSTLCEPLNESCSITHEEFLPNTRVCIIKNCGHMFNPKAINEWLVNHQTCPNCRYNILTNSNIISYNDQDTNNKFFFNINQLIKFFYFIHQ